MKNIEINGKEAVIRVNSKFFSLETVYSAAYVLIDRAYFTFDGNPDREIEIYLSAKEGEDPGKIAKEFQNELVNHSVYMKQAERNRKVREAIIKRALGTNLEGEIKNLNKVKEYLSPEKKDE
ncbi:MAG: hypothetical protein ABEK36_00605 [Candidatus Aenigmatarchaeota archaeon]